MSTNGPVRGGWQAVADDLRRRLDAGEWTGQLPARRSLMDRYGVADRTLARALHQLRDEGYLIARPRIGWEIRPRRSVVRSTRSRLSREERAAGRGTFMTDCADAGLVPAVTSEVRIEEASDDVGDVLGLAPGALVCVRRRTMRGDEEVLQLATSYLPRSITEGTRMEEEDTGPGGIYARLEDAGYVLSRFTERVGIERATASEAEQMQISLGDPVFRVFRTAWSGETAVEVNDITITGNRYQLVYDLPAE